MFSFNKKYFLLFICLLLALSSCKWNSQKFSNPKLIVCTTTIIGDIVQQLVGNEFRIKTLMGAGVDPHIYEAKPSDVRALGEAKVIISNGLHLEGKMTDLFDRLKNEKEIIYFSDGMNSEKLIRLTEHSFDPHVWFDVRLWLEGIINCKKQLIRIYPNKAQLIERNYLILEKKLTSLNLKIIEILNNIPKSKRVLITSHDAFHYFGKAYGIEVKALQGVSTVTEPGVRNISNLVEFIVRRKIPSVYIESSVSAKAIESVLEACKSKGHQLKIGGMLYSDALGGRNSNADTYIKMILKNTKTFSSSMR